jgi:hypothetical protein
MISDLRDYYLEPGPFTSLGEHASAVDALPDDLQSLVHAAQMLIVHRWWAERYGVQVTPDTEKGMELHGTAALIDDAMRVAPAPLGATRLPNQRVVAICRHYSTTLAAFLKQKGVPARARCGFATYFNRGGYEDHWVTEYWRDDESRWVQVDAQLDTFQHRALDADFDPLDVPRDRFIVAGEVWRQYRDGKIDPDKCGIADMRGDWFIRGNHALDMAALQRIELLPWEPFGTAKSPESTIGDTPELLEIVDQTAAFTSAGDDASVATVLKLAERDERLRPPDALMASAARNDAAAPADRKAFLASPL